MRSMHDPKKQNEDGLKEDLIGEKSFLGSYLNLRSFLQTSQK
jgi:hypothetical protein